MDDLAQEGFDISDTVSEAAGLYRQSTIHRPPDELRKNYKLLKKAFKEER